MKNIIIILLLYSSCFIFKFFFNAVTIRHNDIAQSFYVLIQLSLCVCTYFMCSLAPFVVWVYVCIYIYIYVHMRVIRVHFLVCVSLVWARVKSLRVYERSLFVLLNVKGPGVSFGFSRPLKSVFIDHPRTGTPVYCRVRYTIVHHAGRPRHLYILQSPRTCRETNATLRFGFSLVR